MKYSANSVWENKDEYDVVIVGAGPDVKQRLRVRGWDFRH